MTDEEIQAWLSSQVAVPCVLVEATANISDVETTIYMANKGYVTKPTDSPANTYYTPRITNKISFVESISLDSSPNMSFGDLYIDNSDRSKDAYVDYVWSDRDITVYFGDLSWDRADFFEIFTGKTENIDSRDMNTLILKVRDKMQQLNSPITDDTLGGATDNKSELKPLVFGEACNITPLLINPATHQYQVHNGTIEDIIEVRDYGYPVSSTDNLSNGTFTLSSQPSGTITTSVQGDKNATYNKTVAGIIKHIVKTYGVDPFTDADIDLTNFSDYDSAHPQQVSYFSNSKENILSIISYLANSLGSQLINDRLGKLRILQIDLPPSDTPYEVNPNDIRQNSLELVELPDVKAAIKLGYCKNYTVQQDLQTGIIEKHKAFFAKEWIIALDSDSAVATKYKLDTEVDQIDTALITQADADTEATRLLTLWKTQRKVYRFKGIARLMTLQLGQAITLKSDLYGLDAGVTGMLIHMDTNWTNREVTCEVLV